MRCPLMLLVAVLAPPLVSALSARAPLTQKDSSSVPTPAVSPIPHASVPSVASRAAPGPWEVRFEELLLYKQVHGHCRVPKRYTSNKPLANWVSKQRQAYRKFQQGEKASITPERIDALEKIGFCWNTLTEIDTTTSLQHDSDSQAQWWCHYQSLRDFMSENNVFSVANLPRKSSHEAWIKEQRRRYVDDMKYSRKRLSEEQIGLLNRVDPQWHLNRHEYLWEKRFQELVAYANENGDCCVPISYSNRKLANWVSNQRKLYTDQLKGKRNSLDDRRKRRLDKIGFVWNRWEYEFNRKNVVEGTFVDF